MYILSHTSAITMSPASPLAHGIEHFKICTKNQYPYLYKPNIKLSIIQKCLWKISTAISSSVSRWSMYNYPWATIVARVAMLYK